MLEEDEVTEDKPVKRRRGGMSPEKFESLSRAVEEGKLLVTTEQTLVFKRHRHGQDFYNLCQVTKVDGDWVALWDQEFQQTFCFSLTKDASMSDALRVFDVAVKETKRKSGSSTRVVNADKPRKVYVVKGQLCTRLNGELYVPQGLSRASLGDKLVFHLTRPGRVSAKHLEAGWEEEWIRTE